MAEGGALSEQGEHQKALESFEAAFNAMPTEIQVGEVGEFVAYNGGTSALRVFEAQGDATALERGKALLGSFISAVEGAAGAPSTASTERVRETLAEIDALLDARNEAAREETVPAEEVVQDPDGEPVEVEDVSPGTDRVGLALTIVGGLAIAGGAATIVAGTQQVPWYEGELEHFGWTPDSTDYDYEAKLDEARRVRNIDIGVGAGVAAVGVGLLIYGAVRLGKARRSSSPPAHVHATPSIIARGTPGTSIILRF